MKRVVVILAMSLIVFSCKKKQDKPEKQIEEQVNVLDNGSSQNESQTSDSASENNPGMNQEQNPKESDKKDSDHDENNDKQDEQDKGYSKLFDINWFLTATDQDKNAHKTIKNVLMTKLLLNIQGDQAQPARVSNVKLYKYGYTFSEIKVGNLDRAKAGTRQLSFNFQSPGYTEKYMSNIRWSVSLGSEQHILYRNPKTERCIYFFVTQGAIKALAGTPTVSTSRFEGSCPLPKLTQN